MKTFITYVAVGVAGYLIGFYEMKYKTVKAIAQSNIDELMNMKEKANDNS